MNCSIGKIEREINAEGVEYDGGSVFERFGQLMDIRKARGKRFSLETILTIIVMAKMCGEDTPSAIADWAKNHQEQILKLLQLKRPQLPHYNTYRWVLAHVVYEEEIARMVGEYHQRGDHGEVYAMDGKAPHGMRKKDEDRSEYLLSVYDVEQAKGMSQVAVGRKENEIKKVPEALKKVEISRKIITTDAMHTQKRYRLKLSTRVATTFFQSRKINFGCIKIFNNSLRPNIRNPALGKFKWIFSLHKK